MTDQNSIKEADIRKLMEEAQAAGDEKQVEDCRYAMIGDEAAFDRCVEAIARARAMED